MQSAPHGPAASAPRSSGGEIFGVLFSARRRESCWGRRGSAPCEREVQVKVCWAATRAHPAP
eukprot:6898458-Prymnesium_polylepis.1